MPSAMDVARYFVAQCDPEEGDGLTNLKLQKLLYYAQGIHLAMTGQALFKESIEAWTHGPVVPDVYHAVKQHGADPVEFDGELDLAAFDEGTRDILDDVFAVYGQFSAWKLRNMTHQEPPWADTPDRGRISERKLREFFETRIIDREKSAD